MQTRGRGLRRRASREHGCECKRERARRGGRRVCHCKHEHKCDMRGGKERVRVRGGDGVGAMNANVKHNTQGRKESKREEGERERKESERESEREMEGEGVRGVHGCECEHNMQGGKRGGERKEGGEGGRRVCSSEYNDTDANTNTNAEREGGCHRCLHNNNV
jgi:hypothetical protein